MSCNLEGDMTLEWHLLEHIVHKSTTWKIITRMFYVFTVRATYQWWFYNVPGTSDVNPRFLRNVMRLNCWFNGCIFISTPYVCYKDRNLFDMIKVWEWFTSSSHLPACAWGLLNIRTQGRPGPAGWNMEKTANIIGFVTWNFKLYVENSS